VSQHGVTTLPAAGLLLAILLAMAPGPLEAAPAAWQPEKTHALLVGILEWQDAGLSSFPKKNRRDRELQQVLEDAGVPRDHIVFLEDAKATQATILRELARVAERAGAGSTLLFYFAGHGTQAGGETVLCNYDIATARAKATGITVSKVGEILRQSWKGERLILLADCCHSGGLASIVRAYDGDPRVRAASLTSATASNVSTGNWTFTESVIAAFGGKAKADVDRDGRVTIEDADAYVYKEMRYRESQLARGARSTGFERGFALSTVAPADRVPETSGPWQVFDYPEVEWKGKWYPGQVIGVKGAAYRIHYLDYDDTWEEWMPAARLRKPRGGSAEPGDRVEVEWKGEWWAAKVAKVEDDFFYFIQYDGYGREWDEWVTPKRMRKLRR
jgi:hypothetical protein